MSTTDRAREVPITEAAAKLGIELHRDGRHELKGHCPKCRGPVHIRPDKARAGLFYCHTSDVGGDPIDLVRHVRGVGFREAVRLLTSGHTAPTESGSDREARLRALRWS